MNNTLLTQAINAANLTTGPQVASLVVPEGITSTRAAVIVRLTNPVATGTTYTLSISITDGDGVTAKLPDIPAYWSDAGISIRLEAGPFAVLPGDAIHVNLKSTNGGDTAVNGMLWIVDAGTASIGTIIDAIASDPAQGISFVRSRLGKGNTVALRLALAAGYQRFCRAPVLVSGQFHVTASNSGSAWLKGVDGNDIELSKGQSYTVVGVDISQTEWKGTIGDVVTFLGGTW